MATGIITQIVQGVVAPEDNYALNYLATLLGDKLVFNTGTNASLLAYLSAALAPIYLGVLFAIMAYIGIGGTAKTAMDGEFLGRGWHSVGVPSFLMMCIILLSPVPNQNGITLGQVIFVKSVVLGSNFGDVVLKTAVEQNALQSQAAAASSSNADLANETNAQLKVVSDRMINYLKIYACSMQYTVNGGSQDEGYFLQLASLCGVPTDSVSMYVPYFSATTLTKDPTTGQMVPTKMPAPNFSAATSDSSKEYTCMFNTFEKLRKTAPPAGAIAASGGIIKNVYPIRLPEEPVGSGNIVISSRAQVRLDMNAMLGVWPIAVMETRSCLYKNIQAADNNKILNYANQSIQVESWSKGWALAAALASDDLLPMDMDTSSSSDPDIKSPQPSNLPNTGSDSLAQMQIATLIRQIDEARESIDGQMSNLALAANENSNSTTSSASQYTNAAKIGVAATANGALVASKTMTGTTRVSARAFSNGIFKVWGDVPGGSFVKRSANLQASGVGSVLKAAKKGTHGMLQLFIKASESAALLKELSDVQIMGFKGVGLIAKGLSAAGKVAGKAVKIGAALMFNIPGLAPLIGYLLIVLNVITLAPEIIMAIALMLWLMQVAAWFLMVPIATLIIAIPNTRVGHSSWRSALALALTPGVIVLFYLVSLVMFDIIIEVSMSAVFLPYKQIGGENYATIAGRILMDIFTGEIVFRILALVGLLGVGFFFTLTLVLRGPRWFFSKVGLDSSMDEFGGELSQGMESKLKMTGSSSALRHVF